MCLKKNRSIVKEENRTVAHPVRVYAFICICIYMHETFSGTTNLARCALVGGSGCWQRDSRSSMEVEAVKGKIGERGWWERMRTLKDGARRRGSGRCWSWRFVDAGQRSGSSSRCLPSACYCLFKWPIRTASVTGTGATIAWKIAREIAERGKGGGKKKEISSAGRRGEGMFLVASRLIDPNRRLGSIRLRVLVILYFEQLT